MSRELCPACVVCSHNAMANGRARLLFHFLFLLELKLPRINNCGDTAPATGDEADEDMYSGALCVAQLDGEWTVFLLPRQEDADVDERGTPRPRACHLSMFIAPDPEQSVH